MPKALIDDLYNGLNTSDGKKVKEMFQNKLCSELYEIDSDLNTSNTGIKSRLSTVESDLNTANTGIKARVTTLESQIADENKVKIFDTISDAQAYTGFFEGDRIQVLGYYSKNDVAGHERVYSLTDDGSGVPVASGGFLNYIIKNGVVNVLHFGAKGDGVYDDSLPIQKALNINPNQSGYSQQFSNYSFKVLLGKKHLLSTPVYINKSNVVLDSLVGKTLIIGDTSLTNEEFILYTGVNSDKTLASVNDVKIRNIKFTRKNSNPYVAGYDSSTFGSGKTYQFKQSCNGLYFADAHYSYVENCYFIGLRCGIKFIGSWASHLKECHFVYNDRHIFGKNSPFGDSNNANIFSNLTFGTSVMTAGVYLEEFDNISFYDINYEQSHQTPIMLRSCRGVVLNGYLHAESNNKFRTELGIPSYVSESTTFMPVNEDVYLGVLNGCLIICSTCFDVTFNRLHNNDPLTSVLVMNSYCRDDIKLIDCNWFTNYIPIDFMTKINGTTTSKFYIDNLNTEFWYMIGQNIVKHINSPITKTPSSFRCPTVWYLDSNSPSTGIKSTDITDTNRINLFDLRFLPDIDDEYVINVKGTTNLILPKTAKVKIVGLNTTDSIITRIYAGNSKIVSVEKVKITIGISFLKSSDNTELSFIEELNITNCEYNSSDVVGMLQSSGINLNKKTVIKNSNFYQNNATIGYPFVVQNNKVFMIDCNILNAKRVSVRDYGEFLYKNVVGANPLLEGFGTITQVV